MGFAGWNVVRSDFGPRLLYGTPDRAFMHDVPRALIRKTLETPAFTRVVGGSAAVRSLPLFDGLHLNFSHPGLLVCDVFERLCCVMLFDGETLVNGFAFYHSRQPWRPSATGANQPHYRAPTPYLSIRSYGAGEGAADVYRDVAGFLLMSR